MNRHPQDCCGVWKGHVVPYQRTLKTANTRAKNRYKASQSVIGAHLLQTWAHENGGVRFPAWRVPFYFGLLVTMPPTLEGLFSGSAGDIDNFVKAFLDAAQAARFIERDDARLWRGITVAPDGGPTRFILGPEWRFHWAFVAVDCDMWLRGDWRRE